MNNPTLLKGNVNFEQALETIDYLYGIECEIKTMTDEYGVNRIRAYYNGEHVINYNSEYGQIMISKDYYDDRKKRFEEHILQCRIKVFGDRR